MNKRVHEIAKQRGLPPKEVLERLRTAGMNVKAASSSVDEAEALRALGEPDGGESAGTKAAAPAASAGARAADARGARPAAGAKGARPAAPEAEAGRSDRAARQGD